MMNLAEMISTLSDGEERALMRLRYLGGHRIKDIAASTRMSERNVQRILRQAKNELKEKYPHDFHLD